MADTVTEVFLFVALKRGQKPPDEKHPFGYGRETYFWAFLASLTTFLVGAGFSFYQGITTIIEREPQGDPLISYIVLAVSFVLEGISFLKAVRQVRGAARKWGVTPGRLPVPDDGHHGQGGHLRGHRGAGRPGARRARPVPRADDRRPAVGRRRRDRHRPAAARRRLRPGAGEHVAADRAVGVPAHRAGAQGGDRRHGARRRRPVPAHLGDRPRASSWSPPRSTSTTTSTVGRHRADRRRGGAAAGRPARGRALRLPRPDRRRRPGPGPGPPARRTGN